MKLEEHIRLSILNYPTIFKNRSDVLDHLFCVIGNGYEWENGELVAADTNREATNKREAKKALTDWLSGTRERLGLDFDYEFSYRERKKPKESRVTFARRWMKVRWADAYEAIEDIDNRVSETPDKSFYPICEYSRMCTVPDDVREDWLSGVIECCQLVIDSKLRTRYNKSNKQKAKKALKKLLALRRKRFGK